MSIRKKLKKTFESPTILCFSIVTTGRCNARCSYCHFYGMRDKKSVRAVWKDISESTYRIYIKFLKRIKALLPDNVDLQYRFSGEEPLVLGDRLFKMADYGYKETGIAPYVLTNGLAITDKWIEEAKSHYIKYLFVSVENPFNPDPGASNPIEIVDKMSKFNSQKLPIIPGITIVKNKDFKLLYDICKYFYKKLGVIPAISELNYQAFEIPSKQEYKDLYHNIVKVVKNFHNKAQLVLFPYVSPELSYGGENQCLMELDINNNRYGFSYNNIDKKIELVIKQIKRNYPDFHCEKRNCEWLEFCKSYKWLWGETFGKMTPEEKQKSYCNLKKTINQSFYDAVEDIQA